MVVFWGKRGGKSDIYHLTPEKTVVTSDPKDFSVYGRKERFCTKFSKKTERGGGREKLLGNGVGGSTHH